MLLDQRALAPSVEALLAGAERREPFVNPDGRSSSAFERVWIDGVAHIVKYVHVDSDFTMRVSGDVRCRTARAWAAGLLDAAPHLVDHTIVGAALVRPDVFLQAIVDGKMLATCECNPRFGPKAFETMQAYAAGETLPDKIINPDRFFDPSNAAEFLPEAY